MQYSTTFMTLALATVTSALPQPFAMPQVAAPGGFPQNGDPCPLDGAMICLAEPRWALCNQGKVHDMGVTAAGMACIPSSTEGGSASMVDKKSVTDAFALDAARRTEVVLETLTQLMNGELDWNVAHTLMTGNGLEIELVREDQIQDGDIVLDDDADIPTGTSVQAPQGEAAEKIIAEAAPTSAEVIAAEAEGVEEGEEGTVEEVAVPAESPIEETVPAEGEVVTAVDGEAIPVEGEGEFSTEVLPFEGEAVPAEGESVESVEGAVEEVAVPAESTGEIAPPIVGGWDPVTGLWNENLGAPVVRRASPMGTISKRRGDRGCVRFHISARGPYFKCA